ncbi:glycosyltransferase [Candidatus Atribacteria bacterium HGW-Atribacteria-1]|nr:MAG: glycosyltransferase [Candidatus Atribacteria bacterium HGW-Atribacteria-1]
MNELQGIKVIDMGITSSNYSSYVGEFFRIKRKSYKFFEIINHEKPDIIISFSHIFNPYLILTKLFMRKIKVILTLHNYPSIDFVHFFEKTVYKLLLKQADRIITCSKICGEDAITRFNAPEDKVITIYNPVYIEKINNIKNEEIEDELFFKNNNPKIISVGALHYRKGFNYLLKAFKLIRENGINANLIILGEGSERTNLEILVRDLNLENEVILPGYKANPYKYIKNSDIFVLPSLWEGLPLVLVEAMICEVPIIATICPSGVEELITHNVNGILVPSQDEKELANAIMDLLNNKGKAKELAKEGNKKIHDFDAKKTIKEYEKEFIKVYYNS